MWGRRLWRCGSDKTRRTRFSLCPLISCSSGSRFRCMKDKFFEEIEKLDFENDPESQRLYINNWVENPTHGEITDLLTPGSTTKNTKLAIANAAYFKGTWQSKFKPEETQKEIFYVSNERQEFVDMMHVEGTFNHAANEKLGCHILELPCFGRRASSTISSTESERSASSE
ncbi:serpin B6 [Culex quinquefasciatus]|uniref:Serpin B6 n=1 Tax=Culex quinquefasciatus TaxID=7176 RepID=B0X7R5_CULQU|nr:serpin B6 [Culex quinquefasciatus]|eukprot:XP_001865687.1 serpin B6 [Culex quinquefasciatus]